MSSVLPTPEESSSSFQKQVLDPVREDIYQLLEASLEPFPEVRARDNLDVDIEVRNDKTVCVAIVPKMGYPDPNDEEKRAEENMQSWMAGIGLGELRDLSYFGTGKAARLRVDGDPYTILFESLTDLKTALAAGHQKASAGADNVRNGNFR